MSRAEEINYPPQEVQEPLFPNKKSFEHIILWMLKNNDTVEWSHFAEEPIKISQASLSTYTNKLINQGYVLKLKRGVYQITPEGENRYYEISQKKSKKRKLSYPPKTITSKRNWDHVILWMVYNNNNIYYCKWSDFIAKPLLINSSSLSKNIHLLIDKQLIEKEKKEYRITQAGKLEYSEILKLYDLDRQSILDEESKRIKDITEKTVRFFDKYNIEDDSIKFRFLNNVLKLPYATVQPLLKDEEIFNKILLYLSLNHPDQYPDYTTPSEFSKKFQIKKVTLEYYIEEIIENNIYSIKFFQLEVGEDNHQYYFQGDEYLEKMLGVKVDNYITKYTYLKRLYSNNGKKTPSLNKENLIQTILDDISGNLFNNGLGDALKAFLPDYITYLAYKMETQKKLEDITDKLEGTIWRDFQYYSTADEPPKTYDENRENYYMSPHIFEILDDFYIIPSTSSVINKTKKMLKNKAEYKKALDFVNSSIEKDLSNSEIMLFKSRVLCHLNKYIEAIDLIDNKIDYEQYKDEEKIYVASSFILAFAYTAQGKVEDALRIVDKTYNIYPDNPILLAAKAVIYGYSIIYDFDVEGGSDDYVLDLIDNVIRIDSNRSNKARYYQFKSAVMEQMDKEEEALDEIDIALGLTENIVDLYYSKSKILTSLGKHDEALILLREAMNKFPESERHLLMQEAYIHKMSGDIQSGLDIITNLTKTYPEEIDLLNNKAYWHSYIYKNNKDKGIEDEENKLAAIKTIKYLTEIAPEEGNYFDSYGEILMTTGDIKNAIKMYEKAIETEPNGWFIPASHVGIGKCNEILGFYNKAEVNFQKARKIVRYCFCHIKNRKEWIEEIENHLKKIKELKQK